MNHFTSKGSIPKKTGNCSAFDQRYPPFGTFPFFKLWFTEPGQGRARSVPPESKEAESPSRLFLSLKLFYK